MVIIKFLSVYSMPFIILVIMIVGIYKNLKVFDLFLEGAKEGLITIFKIAPSIVGLLVAVATFRASGALDFIFEFIKPITSLFSIPTDIVPLALLKPISGSASLAMVVDIFKNYGPDSFIGRVASTMMASTETIFYTLAVYFGAVGIKKTGYTLPAALTSEFISIIVSIFICNIIF